MANENNKITRLNIISSLILNTVTILSGFIIPRLILSTLGSEVNGLYLSIDQYLNFFSLLEGGLGGVVMASLYKPLYEKNIEKVSSIIFTVTKFFRKIAILFIIYLIIVSFAYPAIVKTTFSNNFITSLSFILGINFFIRYYFLLVIRMLLHADRKIYITTFVQSILVIIEILLFIIVIRIFPSIHFIKLVSSFIYIVQYFILDIYVNKHYNLNKKAPIDIQLISQRWDGMGIMAASFIHVNTDLIVLTTFTDLYSVSIYTIYSLVVNAIKSIISSIVSAFSPTIGLYIAKGDKKELKNVFESFEFVITFITFLLYTTCVNLIIPFVMLYTKGVTDTNYFQVNFALVITLAQLQYSLREPINTILYAANRYKDIRLIAYLEAFLNIVISIALVLTLGLVGVALGTLISITVRHILHIIYLKKNILHRRYLYPIKLYFLFYVGFVISYLFINNIILDIEMTYALWVVNAIIVFIVNLIIYSIISYVFFNKEFLKLICKIKGKV